MPTAPPSRNEAAILGRIFGPGEPTFPPEAARALLELDFRAEDRDRMRRLAAKAREGTLTEEERAEADAYGRVGSLLSILKSKVRRSLKDAGIGAA
jgi:hypothetical protein